MVELGVRKHGRIVSYSTGIKFGLFLEKQLCGIYRQPEAHVPCWLAIKELAGDGCCSDSPQAV